jgi:two-component system, chemotaxis family, response regulator WspF
MKIATVGVQSQRAIRRALAESEHTLIWSANSPSDALRKFDGARPEVLLINALISEMTPAALTRAILAKGSCAVLLLAESGAGHISEVYDAMGAGAFDVVAAPLIDTEGRLTRSEPLLLKLRTAARLLGHGSQQLSAVEAPRSGSALVAIGASTGGPQALFAILTKLPKNFPGAIVIVQHVDEEFSEGLASWLRDGSDIRVDIARDGMLPMPGLALIAGSSDHLVMTAGGTLRYRAEPVEMPYRPSVDVLFSSLAEHWPKPAVAVLLTGMGRDGAEGMRKLRQLGWHTIAQDEASSVVYGMPKAAALLGAACKILPLPAIANEVIQHVGKSHIALH